ncbi:outer membrane protein TolC precursor [mine drainage metagenome]|uniref:Outer membrane protein TolC n=1 Tax=mine drainage metagenome TaxID=410659 RepID=A0A1J5QXM9_9ZZZZ
MDWSDPFEVGTLATSPTGSIHSSACAGRDIHTPLTLAEVVDRTLCQNPKSQEAWANARFQAAQIGVARAPFLPNVSVNGAAARNWNSGPGIDGSYNSQSASISMAYLLYDFGGRDAVLENARQLFAAASATQDSVVQNLFLAAIQGYYQLHATQAALASTQEAERAAQKSLEAATARYKAGVATPADKLQAQTAYSQSVLNRIRASGDLKNAHGTLANLMGMDADREFVLQAVAASPAYDQFQNNVSELIAEARRRRPDLVAAEAQVKAARANILAAEASGKPSVSLTTNLGYQDLQFGDSTHGGAIGLNVTIPLFTGFATTYKIRSAQGLAEAQQAVRDQLNLQVALDVWTAYQNLQTATQSVESSADLVSSATQNADVALGRYKAGVGNIIDVITAQSALASARAQQIQATFNWDIARAGLAYAIGQLDDSHVVAMEDLK